MKIDKRLFASILSSLAVMLVLISIPGAARAQEPDPQNGQASNAHAKVPDPPAQSQAQAVSPPKVNQSAVEEATDSSGTPPEGSPPGTAKAPAPTCNSSNTVKAEVVAIAQSIMLNRLGASIPDGWIFALKSDVNGTGQSAKLKYSKRPRPL